MSRSFSKFFIAAFLGLVFATPGYSQIVLTGPETGVPGELTKIQVKVGGYADLQIKVLQNGKPTTQGFSTLKELDDTPVVMFYTKTSATYTIIASGIKDGKHMVVLYLLPIANPAPIVPDVPVPDPNVKPIPPKVVLTGFNKEIFDLYTASPDAGSLDLLIATLTDLKAFVPNLKTYGDFETTLAATASKRIGDTTKLRKVRDRIGDYLIEKTGSDPRAWNANKATTVCDDVLAALKGCK